MSETKQPQLFADPLELAKQLKSVGRFEKAEKLLLSHMETNPEDQRLRASLADLYYRTQRPRPAMRLAGEILRDNPNDYRALVVMGNALLYRHKAAEALETFHIATQIAPTEYSWTCIARAHLALNQPQQALEALVNSRQYAKPNAHMHAIQVRAELMRGDQQAFRQALLQMAHDAPQTAADFFRYFMPLLQKLSSRQSLQALDLLRENNLQGHNPQLLMFELEISLRCNDTKRARQCLTELESLDQPNMVQQAQVRYAEEVERKHKHRGKPLC